MGKSMTMKLELRHGVYGQVIDLSNEGWLVLYFDTDEYDFNTAADYARLIIKTLRDNHDERPVLMLPSEMDLQSYDTSALSKLAQAIQDELDRRAQTHANDDGGGRS